MEAMGYSSYEEYRVETNRRMPKTLEAHKKKLEKKLNVLYQQKDYRALEVVMELVDALADDSEPVKAKYVYWIVGDILEASESDLEICSSLLRVQSERRREETRKRKQARKQSKTA